MFCVEGLPNNNPTLTNTQTDQTLHTSVFVALLPLANTVSEFASPTIFHFEFNSNVDHLTLNLRGVCCMSICLQMSLQNCGLLFWRCSVFVAVNHKWWTFVWSGAWSPHYWTPGATHHSRPNWNNVKVQYKEFQIY